MKTNKKKEKERIDPGDVTEAADVSSTSDVSDASDLNDTADTNGTRIEFKTHYCSVCGQQTLHDNAICIKCCLKQNVSKNWIRKWCKVCKKETLHTDSVCTVCEEENNK